MSLEDVQNWTPARGGVSKVRGKESVGRRTGKKIEQIRYAFGGFKVSRRPVFFGLKLAFRVSGSLPFFCFLRPISLHRPWGRGVHEMSSSVVQS